MTHTVCGGEYVLPNICASEILLFPFLKMDLICAALTAQWSHFFFLSNRRIILLLSVGCYHESTEQEHTSLMTGETKSLSLFQPWWLWGWSDSIQCWEWNPVLPEIANLKHQHSHALTHTLYPEGQSQQKHTLSIMLMLCSHVFSNFMSFPQDHSNFITSHQSRKK